MAGGQNIESVFQSESVEEIALGLAADRTDGPLDTALHLVHKQPHKGHFQHMQRDAVGGTKTLGMRAGHGQQVGDAQINGQASTTRFWQLPRKAFLGDL